MTGTFTWILHPGKLLLVFLLATNSYWVRAGANPVPAPQDYPDKVALLISVADYGSKNEMEEAQNNLRDLEFALSELGFRVFLVTDPDREALLQGIATFQEYADRAIVAFAYYSGRIRTTGDRSFLMPAGARLKQSFTSAMKQGVDLELLTGSMKASDENVVSLDAYRWNFKRTSGKNALPEKLPARIARPEESRKRAFLTYLAGEENIAYGDTQGISVSLFSKYFSEAISNGDPYQALLKAQAGLKRETGGEAFLQVAGFLEGQYRKNSWNGYRDYMRDGRIQEYSDDPPVSYFIEEEPFPWPPPRASATYILPQEIFNGAQYLREIDNRLRKALDATGYYDFAYFPIADHPRVLRSLFGPEPDLEGLRGFVLLTRIEQINPDGTPVDNDSRWALEIEQRYSISIREYLSSLFFPRKGHFRVIAFAVTDKPFKQTTQRLGRQRALDLVSMGNHNNSWFAQKELNDAFSVTALIYEYELSENSVEAYLLRSSDLPGRVHLERSRIWEFLQNRP